MSIEPEVPLSDPRIGVTNLEPGAMKTGVKGYTQYPVVELGDGVIGCEYCGYTRFRRSKVRFPDVMEFLRMRYPVRCMRCSQRQYQSIDLALLSAATKTRATRLSEGNETWQNWTTSSPETPLSTRPMSTAVGTHAQRLGKQVPVATNGNTPPADQQRRGSDGEIW